MTQIRLNFMQIMDLLQFIVINDSMHRLILLTSTLNRMQIHKKDLLRWKSKERKRDSVNDQNTRNRKGKGKSMSTGSIFGLPKAVIESFKTLEPTNLLKREKSTNKNVEQPIELGSIGQQYHTNLRKTIMNHTKQIFRPLKKHKSFLQENNYLSQDDIEDIHMRKRQNKIIASIQENSNYNTFNMLQKAISREGDAIKEEQSIFELQASRLPIIQKKESRRKQSLIAFQAKYFPPSPSPPRQPRQQPKPTYTLRPKRVYPPQKPEICGWDMPDMNQY